MIGKTLSRSSASRNPAQRTHTRYAAPARDPRCGVALLALLVLAAITAAGQETDSLLARGRADFSRGDLDSAKACYETVLSREEHSLPALIGLGRIALAEEEWSDAAGYMDDALEIDPENIEAHLYAGIAAREQGTAVALIFQTIKWNSAEEHFRRVMQRDSLYRDVLCEYALLWRYRKNYDLAQDLIYLQLARTPQSPRAQLSLVILHRFMLAEEDSATVRRWLRRHPTAFSAYFGGELLRRMHSLAQAEQIFASLLVSPKEIPVQAMHLSLAKLATEAGQPRLAEAHYWTAVDRISSWLGAALIFEDLKYIVNDAEMREYNTLTSDRKKQAFFRAFWARRNPTPSARTNPRLQEHYRRLVAAEGMYEYYGFRNMFNDPERFKTYHFPRSFKLNKEFNDKGLIFIRHGLADVASRTINDVESWIYFERAPDPQRIFTFALSNSARNNWRLVSVPRDRELLQDLAMYDSRYQQLLMADNISLLSRENEIILQSQNDVEEALTTDRHTWTSETIPLSVPGSVDIFRGEKGRSLLDISYGVPLGEIAQHMPASEQTARIEVGVNVSTLAGVPVAGRIDTVTRGVGSDVPNSFVGLFRLTLEPGSFVVSLHVKPLGSAMIGGWKDTVSVRDFNTGELTLSDLQFLLPSSQEPAIEIEGVKVVQSPFEVVPANQPLYTYIHVYNITKDFWGNTHYTVRFLLSPPDAQPGEDETVLLEESQKGTEDYVPVFKMLDIRNIDTGRYRLTVEVVDNKKSRTVRAYRTLEVVE